MFKVFRQHIIPKQSQTMLFSIWLNYHSIIIIDHQECKVYIAVHFNYISGKKWKNNLVSSEWKKKLRNRKNLKRVNADLKERFSALKIYSVTFLYTLLYNLADWRNMIFKIKDSISGKELHYFTSEDWIIYASHCRYFIIVAWTTYFIANFTKVYIWKEFGPVILITDALTLQCFPVFTKWKKIHCF